MLEAFKEPKQSLYPLWKFRKAKKKENVLLIIRCKRQAHYLVFASSSRRRQLI